MQPNVLVFFCLAGVLGNARTFPDLLQESDDNDLLFDDQLIHPMQSDEFVDPIIDPDVDPSVGLDEAISLDQDTSWLAKLGEYCTSPTESPERLVDKIRVRRQSCISPKSTPPPPKVEPSSLKLPEEPKHQSPWLGGFPLAAPFIKYPQCYDKMPYCCPSGRMPDNTFQGCKPCEEPKSFSLVGNHSSR